MVTDNLSRGRDAFLRRAWTHAYMLLAAADSDEPLPPEDLERLATAAYLIGKDAESTEIWTRAHQEFLGRGAVARAARCAFWLAFGLMHQGERARAGGWITRARGLLDNARLSCVEQGYLLLPIALQRLFAGDAAGAYSMFSQAAEIGDRFGDRDLIALARHSRGRVLIRMGEIRDGVGLLDEAMAIVDAGEVSPHVVGDVYCSVIEGCLEVFDLRRAQEWTAALTRWCEAQPDLVPYRGQCLVRRAEILQLHGAWPEAIEAARQACNRLLQPSPQPASGAAFYQCGELSRLRGKFAEADDAYRNANRYGRKPQPGLALLRLAQGQTEMARTAIQIALDEAHGTEARSRLLPAYVEIMLAAGDIQAARMAADELEALADALDAPMLTAVAAQARGAVRLAEGDARAALPVLRQAWTGWQEVGAAYDAARLRVLIGLASRDLGDVDAAEMEFDAARRIFQQLGARPDLTRVEALSRALKPAPAGGLSAREIQVLRLVAAGKTNRQIASVLFISERTVERHLSNIFNKLDLTSRSAATAYAYEHKLVQSRYVETPIRRAQRNCAVLRMSGEIRFAYARSQALVDPFVGAASKCYREGVCAGRRRSAKRLKRSSGAVPDGRAEARHPLSQRSSLPASRTRRERGAAIKGGIAVGALKCATRSGSAIMLPHAAVDDFRSRLRGVVLGRGDDGYDRARVVFNAMIERLPALIVQCAGAADVREAVMFAREHNLLVSIRGGGHGVTGNAVCDDGLVIDLSRMRSVRADPVTQTARAEGGATWGDFDRETQAFGLASTGGIVPTTGIAGLTLGGGIGYLNRKYGLACDNLISADVVTADGRVLKASAQDNCDLFWALRGGGGNFGVVTSLEYRIHPVGPVLGGELIFPLDRAKETLRFYRDWSLAAPDEVRADASLVSGPEGPALAIIVCYCGSIDEGERVLRPLRQFGSPVVDTIDPSPYARIQNLLTEVLAPGFCHYWKSGFFRSFSDDAIERLVDFFAADVPSPFAAVAIEHLGGAIGRVGERDTAFSHRRAQHSCLVLRAWRDPAASEDNIAWGRSCYDAVEPFLEQAVYVNYLGDEGDSRVRAAYGANYQRLAALKQKYDPTNFFRGNQNIQPAET